MYNLKFGFFADKSLGVFVPVVNTFEGIVECLLVVCEDINPVRMLHPLLRDFLGTSAENVVDSGGAVRVENVLCSLDLDRILVGLEEILEWASVIDIPMFHEPDLCTLAGHTRLDYLC